MKNLINILLELAAILGKLTFNISEFFANQKKSVTLKRKNSALFFGYYDVSPANSSNTKVLSNIYSGDNFKTPNKNDFIELCYFDIKSNLKEPVVFDKTNTWCWQQGCRLQWLQGNSDLVIYNKLINDKYSSVIYNIETKQIVKELSFPIYSIDSKGKTALSLNFSRLQRLRPGYGYEVLPDQSQNELIPSMDGIFQIDIENNSRNLLVSYEDIVNLKSSFDWNDSEHYLNHLFFNPTDEFIFCFHLWKNKNGRFNRVLMFNKTDKKLSVLDQNCIAASHYTFRSDYELLLTLKDINYGFIYKLYNLQNNTNQILNSKYLKKDSHPSFMNKDNLIIDSYPNKFRQNDIKILNLTTDSYKKVFRGFHPRKYSAEYRCDLHPRLSSDKKNLFIDTIENNNRVMKIIQI